MKSIQRRAGSTKGVEASVPIAGTPRSARTQATTNVAGGSYALTGVSVGPCCSSRFELLPACWREEGKPVEDLAQVHHLARKELGDGQGDDVPLRP
jgi:hypothetical protein